MATSEAQKRASAKYDKENMARRTAVFSPHERDLLEYLDSKANKGGYIKKLIRADMEGRVQWDTNQ